jgi:hypothetical protein
MNAARNKVPAIGEPGWRPTEVHPLAALFPTLPDDDLDALAEHIKANGLQVPIAIDQDGTLIDGRMRLQACDKAGVEPEYQFINGHDPEEYIWGANGKRRQMTKGQMAMIAAASFATKQRGDETKAARRAGVSKARFSYALTVKEYAPHLVQAVIDGSDMSLDKAYVVAQANERERKWREDGVKMLRAVDRDLAQRVEDQELDLDAARKELETRKKEQHAKRDSALIAMAHGLRSLNGFDRSEALSGLPQEFRRDEATQEHVRQYFKGGVDEIGELIAAARKGLEAIEQVHAKLMSKGR